MRMPGTVFTIAPVVILLTFATALRSAPVDSPRLHLARLVAQVQKADYEGDRAALQRLYGDLAPFAGDPATASRVRYWQGFAMWRRALNGLNESPAPKDVEGDLNEAVKNFNEALSRDPGFVDAKISAASCMGTLIFLFPKSDAPAQEFVAKVVPLLKEAESAAPENPRVLWVLGGNRWYSPGDRTVAQAKAMDTYLKGLGASRQQKSGDALEPSWGEPELLMSLAWANLNRTAPDLNAAEQYAHSALQLVPHWHYVRDILLRQIREAKAKQDAEKKP